MVSGDFVYYTNSAGDTIPAEVVKVMSVYAWIDDGEGKRKVRIASCRLQSDCP